MNSLCFQSFGTNTVGAKEKKPCGISENGSCNIYAVLSGHTAVIPPEGVGILSRLNGQGELIYACATG